MCGSLCCINFFAMCILFVFIVLTMDVLVYYSDWLPSDTIKSIAQKKVLQWYLITYFCSHW